MSNTSQLARTREQDPEQQYAMIQSEIDAAKSIALSQVPAMKKAIVMAQAVRQLREYLTNDRMLAIMELQGTSLGFRTDRDRGDDGRPGPGYPMATVRDCALEAMIRGVMPVGNEFNIIAARAYITREGFTRLVREYPGLSNLVLCPGIPKALEKGGIVPFTATFQLNGESKTLVRDIPVKVNSGQGVDAMIGKGTRKMLAYIYATITGSTFFPDGEIDDDPTSIASGPARGSAAEAIAGMELIKPKSQEDPAPAAKAAEVIDQPPKSSKPTTARAEAEAIIDLYHFDAQTDTDVGFVASCRELKGVMADGRTAPLAVTKAKLAAIEAVVKILEGGGTPPQPIASPNEVVATRKASSPLTPRPVAKS